MSSKSILIVLTQAPSNASANQEALDLALAAATFEQKVTLVYEGDAIYQLASQQQPELIGRKNLPKVMKALPIYGIEDQYIYRPSKCSQLETTKQLTELDTTSYRKLIDSSDTILRF